METTGDAVIITDGTGKILDVNEQACHLLVRERRQLIGRNVLEHMPEGRNPLSPEQAKLLRDGQPVRLSTEVLGPVGKPIPIEATVRKADLRGRGIFVAMVRDVSRAQRMHHILRERNRALAALNSVSSAVTRARSVPQVLRTALKAMMRFAEAEAGGMCEADPAGRSLKLVQTHGLTEPLRREIDGLSLGEGFSGRVLESGQVLIVKDLASDGRLTHVGVVEAGFRSALIVPLQGKRETLGTVFLLSTQVGHFSRVNVRLLTTVAREVALTLENASLLERTITSKRRYDELVGNARDLIFRLDPWGRLEEVNPRFSELTGEAAEQWLGKPALRLVTPNCRSQALSMLRGCLKGMVMTGQLRLATKGRGAVVCLVTLLPVHNSEGRVAALWGMAHDVTRQVLKDREVRTLLAVARAALNAELVNDLCQKVTEEIQRIMDVTCVSIFLYRPQSRQLELVGATGLPPEVRKAIAIQRLDDDPPGLAAEAALRRCPTRVENVRAPLGVGRVHAQSTEGVSELAICSFPLIAGSELAGVLQLAMQPSELLPASETEFLEAAASELAGALRRRRLEFELVGEQHRLDDIISSIGGGLVLVGADGHVLWTNQKMSEWFGGGQVLIGRSWEDVLGRSAPQDRPADAASPVRNVLETAHTEEFDVDCVVLDNKPRLFHVVANPIRDADGRVDRVLLLLLDFTEDRRLRRQLLQSEKLSAIGELVSGVAHELNNPLAAVLGFSELLLSNPDCPPEMRQQLSRINTEAVRCKKIVRNLLSFARQTEPRKLPVCINDTLAGALELKAYQFRVDNVTVVQELAPSGSIPYTMADPHQLQQVFLNILNNAHQAIGRQRRDGRIVVRSEMAKGRIRVSISDNGPGIPGEIISRIFDPFFTIKEVGEGTGLGLSISYGHVRDHDGTIEVDSSPGKGATFIIELPVKPVVFESPTDRPAAATPGVASARKILVVDDEVAMTELLHTILQRMGHHVTTARNGREALRKLVGSRFDLVITDLRMPGMGGQELYQELCRAAPALIGKVIFTTGDTASLQTRGFFRQSGEHLLTKPFKVSDVRGLVEKVLH